MEGADVACPWVSGGYEEDDGREVAHDEVAKAWSALKQATAWRAAVQMAWRATMQSSQQLRGGGLERQTRN